MLLCEKHMLSLDFRMNFSCARRKRDEWLFVIFLFMDVCCSGHDREEYKRRGRRRSAFFCGGEVTNTNGVAAARMYILAKNIRWCMRYDWRSSQIIDGCRQEQLHRCFTRVEVIFGVQGGGWGLGLDVVFPDHHGSGRCKLLSWSTEGSEYVVGLMGWPTVRQWEWNDQQPSTNKWFLFVAIVWLTRCYCRTFLEQLRKSPPTSILKIGFLEFLFYPITRKKRSVQYEIYLNPCPTLRYHRTMTMNCWWEHYRCRVGKPDLLSHLSLLQLG